MVRIIKLDTIEEKTEIENFLRDGTCPERMDNNQKKTFRKKCRKFTLEYNILKYLEDGYLKTVVCRNETDRIFEIFSLKHNVDHSGLLPTYNRIKEEYVGITVEDIRIFINSCQNCLRETIPAINRTVTPILTFNSHDRLIVDTIDMRRYSSNNRCYKYIYTFIDGFSRYAWAYPSISKTGAGFANILEKHFLKEGLWEIFHTDNG